MREKVLIIGGAGFVGNYLIDELINKNLEIYVTKTSSEKIERKDIHIMDLDLLKIEEIEKVINNIRPQYIYNLAAQSSVAFSWKNPQMTVDINIKGIINLLETIRKIENYYPRILLIGSSEEYGCFDENQVNEEIKLEPQNIYAATKAFQSMIFKIYIKAYKMNIVYVRPFNHIGPRQSSLFVVSDFCKQVVEIEKGKKEPIIYVGNLSAKRDFTDVRDVVRVYQGLMKKGRTGEIYNVGSGKAIAIADILREILNNSKVKIEIQQDKSKLRPIDNPVIKANIDKLILEVGYIPKYTINQTIKDILEYWRKEIC